MDKLSKFTLSLLSLLIIIGFCIIPFSIVLGYLIILIGSLSFGSLLTKK